MPAVDARDDPYYRRNLALVHPRGFGHHASACAPACSVTEGVGLFQREGGAVEVIRPGDRAFSSRGENHWHGAAPNRFMVHITMQQSDESGSAVTWGRHVTDEEYAAAPAS
jgi:hypothetical protein